MTALAQGLLCVPPWDRGLEGWARAGVVLNSGGEGGPGRGDNEDDSFA